MVGGTCRFERTCSEEFVRSLLEVLELLGNLGKGRIERGLKVLKYKLDQANFDNVVIE